MAQIKLGEVYSFSQVVNSNETIFLDSGLLPYGSWYSSLVRSVNSFHALNSSELTKFNQDLERLLSLWSAQNVAVYTKSG